MFKFMLAAYRSNSGKTLISSAIIAALARRGLAIAPFKCGPDYLDGLWLGQAAGRTAYNLDSVLCSEDELCDIYANGAYGAAGVVTEGVMGFFDGLDLVGFYGSSYHIATLLDLPVVLVIDASGLAASIVSIVAGIKQIAKDARIAGLILNKVGSAQHELLLRGAMLAHMPDVKLYGAIPRLEDMAVASRPMGLVPPEADHFDRLADIAEQYLDLDGLIADFQCERPAFADVTKTQSSKRALVAYDEAFFFYYQSTFDLLERLGYSIERFSPLRNEGFSAADLVLLGGGYHESYAEQLSSSVATINSLRAAHEAGTPIYAEGGGFSYICLAGIFDIDIEQSLKRQRLGYVRLETPLGNSNGHGFSYSKISRCAEAFYGKAVKLSTFNREPEAFMKNNTYGSFVHMMPTEENSLFMKLIGASE